MSAKTANDRLIGAALNYGDCPDTPETRVAAWQSLLTARDALVSEVRAEERKRLAAEMRELEAGRQKQAPPLPGDLYAEGLRSGWEFAVQHIESSNG